MAPSRRTPDTCIGLTVGELVDLKKNQLLAALPAVLKAAREFAQAELGGHKYVVVLHDHQANPHVHLSVRAESRQGNRLNPRTADLSRWQETFAEKPRGWGVDAEATRQAKRTAQITSKPLWRIKERADVRVRRASAESLNGLSRTKSQVAAIEAWRQIARALNESGTQAGRSSRQVHSGIRQRRHAVRRRDRGIQWRPVSVSFPCSAKWVDESCSGCRRGQPLAGPGWMTSSRGWAENSRVRSGGVHGGSRKMTSPQPKEPP